MSVVNIQTTAVCAACSRNNTNLCFLFNWVSNFLFFSLNEKYLSLSFIYSRNIILNFSKLCVEGRLKGGLRSSKFIFLSLFLYFIWITRPPFRRRAFQVKLSRFKIEAGFLMIWNQFGITSFKRFCRLPNTFNLIDIAICQPPRHTAVPP